jgi:mannitol-specific phosphotransferase system IIBC component
MKHVVGFEIGNLTKLINNAVIIKQKKKKKQRKRKRKKEKKKKKDEREILQLKEEKHTTREPTWGTIA